MKAASPVPTWEIIHQMHFQESEQSNYREGRCNLESPELHVSFP